MGTLERQSSKPLPKSKDDEEKEWNTVEMDKVLVEITGKNSGIGGILAAMVH